ncbi:MAG: GNAT family N-acetyltransferase [Candidatus Methylopumilus sp.]|jgi:hypothetical protein
MSKIDILNDELLQGLPEFNRCVWQFPEVDEFLPWLFKDAPNTTVLVAHDNGRWLAVLGVFRRIYLVDGAPVECGETYAWATLPDRRGSGLGIKVMKAMMEFGRPLVALGGSADTMEFMPRLGFETIGWAPVLNLPLSSRIIGHEGGIPSYGSIKDLIARVGLTMLTPVLRPRQSPHATVRNIPMVTLDQKTLDMPTLPGFQPAYTADLFTWLSLGWRQMGTFLPFHFERDRGLIGWAFARLSEEAPGMTVGRILEFKFSPNTNRRDRSAMVRAVCAALAGMNAMIIRCATTCPDTNIALRSLNFISRSQIPAMVYMADLSAIQEPVRIAPLRADGGLLPLPVRSAV